MRHTIIDVILITLAFTTINSTTAPQPIDEIENEPIVRWLSQAKGFCKGFGEGFYRYPKQKRLSSE